MSNYYTPSGKMSPVAIGYFLLSVCIILPLLGLIYSYAIWYIPIIYVNVLLAIGFGFAIGFVISFLVVNMGKVRSVSKALMFGILGALVAYYFHWVVWGDLLYNASGGNDYFTFSNINISEVIGLAFRPGAIFELVGAVNEMGTWGFGDSPVSGTMLTVVWVIEFLIIMVVATFVSIGFAGTPFCEVENQWFKERALAPFNAISDGPSLIAMLEAGDETLINYISKKSEDQLNHSIFTVYNSDHDESYMSIVNKVAKVDDGKVSYSDQPVVTHIKVTDDLVARMESVT